jgi:MFS transporter, putative metabolite:H+ symporter
VGVHDRLSRVPLAALLGGKLVARHELLGIEGWRWLLLFGGLGAAFILAVRTMLPESPRWLESRGRHAEAREVVESVAAKMLPDRAIPELPETVSAASPDEDARSVAEVLRIAFRDYRKRTVMLVIFQVLQTVAYYGFGTLAPLVLVSEGLRGHRVTGLCSIELRRISDRFTHLGPACGAV